MTVKIIIFEKIRSDNIIRMERPQCDYIDNIVKNLDQPYVEIDGWLGGVHYFIKDWMDKYRGELTAVFMDKKFGTIIIYDFVDNNIGELDPNHIHVSRLEEAKKHLDYAEVVYG